MGGVLTRSVFVTALLVLGQVWLCGCNDNGYPPGCHIDCGGFPECRDGEVTVWEHVAVPCDEFSGHCPHHTFACEKGCREDMVYLYDPYADPSVLCEENRPKEPGDSCFGISDCEPPATYEDEEGQQLEYELTCDTDAGECVEPIGP